LSMNKSEKTAHEWLKQKFPNFNITFNRSSSPDFVVSNGEAFEVKRAYLDKLGKKHIVESSTSQLSDIIRKYPNAKLLVVYDSEILEYSIQNVIEKDNTELIIHTPIAVKISVTIKRSQLEWAKRNHINVSGVLQEALDKMMKKVKFL